MKKTPSSPRSWAAATTLVMLCAQSPAALSTSPIMVEADKRALVLHEKAATACKAGRTEDGVRLLREAYELDADSFYVWSLGRCLLLSARTLEHLDDAETAFISYRTLPDAEQRRLDQVPDQLAMIEQRRKELMTRLPKGPEGEASEEDGLSGAAIGGIASLALGATSGFIAMGLHLSAEELRQDVRDTLQPEPVTGHTEDGAYSKQEEANRRDLGAVIMGAVGGTAVAVGAVLLVVGLTGDSPSDEPVVSVGPWQDLRGASLVARF